MALYQAAIVAGAAVGGIYALIAVGITQVFKVTRVLNVAHVGFVMLAAHLYGYLTWNARWSTSSAALVTCVFSVLLGVAAETVVFRFASRATVAGRVILTLGLFQVMYATSLWFFPPGQQFSKPIVRLTGVDVFGTNIGINQITNLACAFGLVLGISAFLRFTRIGLLTRALVADAQMAELLGARKNRIGMLNWALGAFSAGIAGILIATMGAFSNDFFLTYFIFTLPAVLLGGLSSLALSALGGVLLGIVTTIIGANGNSYGNLFVFGLLAIVVVLKRHWPEELGRTGWTRPSIVLEARWFNFTSLVVLSCVAAAGLVGLAFSNLVWAETAALIVVFSLATASLVPILGWTGQISLAQASLMGIGATSAMSVSSYDHWSFPLALLCGMAAGMAAGGVLGLVVYRLSFVLAAVVTLSFTNVAAYFMVGRLAPWVHAPFGSLSIHPPAYLASTLDQVGVIGLVALVVFVLLGFGARSIWGTRFLAAKTSPVMAAHFGVSLARTRVYAYALSGAIAGLAGSLYVVVLGTASVGYFSVNLSITLLLYAVAGGVGRLVGPVLGSILFIGLPQLFGLNRYANSPWPSLVVGLVIVYLSARSPDGLSAYGEVPAFRPRSSLATVLVGRVAGRLGAASYFGALAEKEA